MTEIFFPDVSHYQAGLRIQPGTPALLAKATEGSTYIDPSYLDFRAQAAAVGAVFGAYHWINGTDPHAQASLCFRVVGRTPVMWDVEAAGATVAQTLAVTAAFRALGGIAHLAYLPRWWWQQHLGSPDLRPLAAAGLGLVSSSYPAAGYTPGGPGWLPYGGVSPVQWQYTDGQPYGGQHVDFNAFMGTAGQYRALLYGIAQPEEDMPAVVHCKENGGYYSYPVPKWFKTEGAVSAGLAAYGMTRAQVVEFPTLDAIRDALGPIPGLDLPVDPHGNVLPTAGGTPAPIDVAAIAKAVNDDAAARLAS